MRWGVAIEIREVCDIKKKYLPLLLLGDAQGDMIDRYLDRGTMYILEENGVKAEFVVTGEGEGILKIRNIAVTIYEGGVLLTDMVYLRKELQPMEAKR